MNSKSSKCEEQPQGWVRRSTRYRAQDTKLQKEVRVPLSTAPRPATRKRATRPAHAKSKPIGYVKDVNGSK